MAQKLNKLVKLIKAKAAKLPKTVQYYPISEGDQIYGYRFRDTDGNVAEIIDPVVRVLSTERPENPLDISDQTNDIINWVNQMPGTGFCYLYEHDEIIGAKFSNARSFGKTEIIDPVARVNAQQRHEAKEQARGNEDPCAKRHESLLNISDQANDIISWAKQMPGTGFCYLRELDEIIGAKFFNAKKREQTMVIDTVAQFNAKKRHEAEKQARGPEDPDRVVKVEIESPEAEKPETTINVKLNDQYFDKALKAMCNKQSAASADAESIVTGKIEPEEQVPLSFEPDILSWVNDMIGAAAQKTKKQGAKRKATMSMHEILLNSELPDYAALGKEIGELVNEKQRAYGNSFGKAGDVLKILYPDGIEPDQYDDALCIVRILDKLFRIATDKDALGESPYRDIAGYGLLGAENSENKKAA